MNVSPSEWISASSTVIDLPSLSAKDVSPIFVELDLVQSEHTRGNFVCAGLGAMSFVRSTTVGNPFQVIRSRELIKKSQSDNLFICMPLEGSIRVGHNNFRTELNKGEIAILDSARWYSIEMPKYSDVFWINVPRVKLESKLILLNKILGQAIICRNGMGQITSDLIFSIFQQLPNISEAEAEPLANNLMDMVSLTLSSVYADASCITTNSNRKLQKIQRYIEDNLQNSELTLHHIANEFHISPRYLCKLFEHEGTTPTRWIIGRRLEQCYQMLKNSGEASKSVAEIAYSNGFNNICSFNKFFKAQYGHTPKALRPNRIR